MKTMLLIAILALTTVVVKSQVIDAHLCFTSERLFYLQNLNQYPDPGTFTDCASEVFTHGTTPDCPAEDDKAACLSCCAFQEAFIWWDPHFITNCNNFCNANL